MGYYFNEGGYAALDFDSDAIALDSEEWEELTPEELERIEIQAEIEELRHNGYGE